jgi:hypothetical protein
MLSPIIILYSANVGEVYPSEIGTPIAITVGFVLLLLLLSWAILKNLRKAAVIITVESAGLYAMVVAGIIVGAAGSLLTIQMARAMNRTISNVFFGAFGATEEKAVQIRGSMKSIEADDVAVMLAYADRVIIAPGFGMAVAQAQQKVKELTILEVKTGSSKMGEAESSIQKAVEEGKVKLRRNSTEIAHNLVADLGKVEDCTHIKAGRNGSQEAHRMKTLLG